MTSESFDFLFLRLALDSSLCLQHLCDNFLLFNQEGSYYPTISITFDALDTLYSIRNNNMCKKAHQKLSKNDRQGYKTILS